MNNKKQKVKNILSNVSLLLPIGQENIAHISFKKNKRRKNKMYR